MQGLLEQLQRLPGIGKRSAERIAFHLLKVPPSEAAELAEAIARFRRRVLACSVCGNVTEKDPCPICQDPHRDATTVLVVEQPLDIPPIESTGQYRGRYHVLMGRIAPLDGVGPEELNVQALLDRIDQAPPESRIREVIIATGPTMEGDGTAMYLAEALADRGVKVTCLARGLPAGVAIETVSKAVLADALHGRRGMTAEG